MSWESAETRRNRRTNESNERIARETNETNLAINEANNAANLELAQKQNAWNIEQWNRENAYNDPSAQMQRYQAAGLNPNNASIDSGNASHLESAELANQQAGHIDSYQQDWQIDNNAQIARILNGIDAMRSIQDIYQSGKLRNQQIESNAINLAYQHGNNILSQQERIIGLSKMLQENTDMTPEQIDAFLQDIPTSKGYSGDKIHSKAARAKDLEISRSQTAYQKEQKEFDIYKEFARDNARYANDNSWADYENKRQDWVLKEIDKTYKGAEADAKSEIMLTYKRMKKRINSLHVDRSTKDALQLELMGAMFGTDSKYVSDAIGKTFNAGMALIPKI